MHVKVPDMLVRFRTKTHYSTLHYQRDEDYLVREVMQGLNDHFAFKRLGWVGPSL